MDVYETQLLENPNKDQTAINLFLGPSFSTCAKVSEKLIFATPQFFGKFSVRPIFPTPQLFGKFWECPI